MDGNEILKLDTNSQTTNTFYVSSLILILLPLKKTIHDRKRVKKWLLSQILLFAFIIQ